MWVWLVASTRHPHLPILLFHSHSEKIEYDHYTWANCTTASWLLTAVNGAQVLQPRIVVFISGFNDRMSDSCLVVRVANVANRFLAYCASTGVISTEFWVNLIVFEILRVVFLPARSFLFVHIVVISIIKIAVKRSQYMFVSCFRNTVLSVYCSEVQLWQGNCVFRILSPFLYHSSGSVSRSSHSWCKC